MSFVGDILGAVIGADATKDAADTQAKAANRSTQLQRDIFNTTREDQAPWRAAGESALNRLMGLLNDGTMTSRFSAGGLVNEPGYQFGLNQGLQGIERSAAARGGALSGAAIKAAGRYAQDYAGTKYNDAFNRWNTENTGIYNRLASVAGLGQQANSQLQQAGQWYGSNAGNNMLDAANASAAARVAQGNIWGNALNSAIAKGNKNNWFGWGPNTGAPSNAANYFSEDYGQFF